MKIYLHDDFTDPTINTSRWTVVPTVSLVNDEAAVTQTTEPGDVAVAGSLTSNVVIPPSCAIHFDTRFITNVNLQSGTGFWAGENVFFRKTDPNWTLGENMQALMIYHVDTDVMVEGIFKLYHRSSAGAALIGQVDIPLDLFESLAVEGAGAVLRDLTIIAQGKRFTIKVGDVEIDQFVDASPLLHVSSPIQFGTGSAVNLTALNSYDNILVTSV